MIKTVIRTREVLIETVLFSIRHSASLRLVYHFNGFCWTSGWHNSIIFTSRTPTQRYVSIIHAFLPLWYPFELSQATFFLSEYPQPRNCFVPDEYIGNNNENVPPLLKRSLPPIPDFRIPIPLAHKEISQNKPKSKQATRKILSCCFTATKCTVWVLQFGETVTLNDRLIVFQEFWSFCCYSLLDSLSLL